MNDLLSHWSTVLLQQLIVFKKYDPCMHTTDVIVKLWKGVWHVAQLQGHCKALVMAVVSFNTIIA